MKRRTFIEKAALGSVAISTLSMCNIAPSKKKKNKLGYALVGLGNYSRGQLGPALLETKNCYLAGIVTGTPEKAAEWSEKYQIPEKNVYNYDNFDEIADNPDIDIVYVVLPNSMHAEFTIRALQAGKHVTCEKPMSTNYGDAVKMIEAANQAGKRLSIGYRLHYDPYNLEMMRLGQKKIYGPITEVDAKFGFELKDKKRWRLSKEMAGGGPLMDVGPYCTQGVIYTLGELPTAVTCQNTTVDKEFFGDVEGALEWQFVFPSGVKNTMESSYEKPFYDGLTAKTETHEFGLRPAFIYNNLKGQINGEVFEYPPMNQQAAQMDAFALNVRDNTECLVPAEMGARDMFLLDKIYEAMDAGTEVSLKGLPQVQHLI